MTRVLASVLAAVYFSALAAEETPTRPAVQPASVAGAGDEIAPNVSDAELVTFIATRHTRYVLFRDAAALLRARGLVSRTAVGDPARSKILLVKRTPDPSENLKALSRLPGTVTLFHDAPGTQEDVNLIHGKTAGAALTNATVRALRSDTVRTLRKSSAKIVDLRKTGSRHSTVLEHALRSQEPNDVLILLGHVDKDGRVPLSDGSFLDLTSVQHPGHLWVIGCDTADVIGTSGDANGPAGGTATRLGYRQGAAVAAWLAKEVTRAHQSCEDLLTHAGVSYADVFLKVQSDKVVSRVVVGLVGTALVFGVVDDES